jgi:lipopolysaccharide export system protein LptA
MIFAHRVHVLRIAPSMLLATCLLAGATVTVSAQTREGRMEGLKLSSDKPIQIASEKLEVQDKDGTAVFTGDVQVVQGDTVMRSNVMTVYYEKKENKREAKDGAEDGAKAGGDRPEAGLNPGANSQIERIVVEGNVYIKSGKQEARAKSGIFNMKTEILELQGTKDEKVVLTENDNVFTGCKLTVHMKDSNAQLDSCPNARVNIVLDPKSQKKGDGRKGKGSK